MSAQRPLGATENATLELPHAALRVSAPATLRTAEGLRVSAPAALRTTDGLRVSAPAAVRSSRAGLLALSGLALTTLLLTIAAAHTNLLLPETVHVVPSWLAGPFGGASINIHSGGLIAAIVVLFICYLTAVRTAERISARAM